MPPQPRGRGRGYQDAPQQERRGGGQRGNPRGGRGGYGDGFQQDRQGGGHRGNPRGGRGGYGDGSQQDRQGGGQRGYPQGRGYGPPRGRQERGGYSRHEGSSGRGGYGPPRGDRGGYRGTGDRQASGRSQEWNPFPEGPGSHPVKGTKFDAEDFGINYKMTITPSTMPAKPGQGKLGKKINLISNCFALEAPSGYVYHYDVDIFSGNRSTATGPETAPSKKYRCLNTKRNRQVVHKMLSDDPHFVGSYGAYDGKKNLLSRIPLDIAHEGLTCVVEVPQRDDSSERLDAFEVVVKPVIKKDSNDCSINLDTLHALYAGIIKSPPLDAIMAIETILRHGPCMRFTPVGRSFFYPPLESELHPLGGGLEIWFGYHQSVRLGQWKPMVNLDMSSTAFYQERPMIDCIAGLIGLQDEGLHNVSYLTDAQIKMVSNKFKNMQIESTHLTYRRKYKFLKLTSKPANKLEFPLIENGVEVRKTVQRFFKETHNKELEYPHLPCIHVHPEKKNNFLPIEVCWMSKGQHCKKKLDEQQTAEMIKFTARPPSDRFHEIKDIRNERAKYEQDSQLTGYEMSVYSEPLQLEARILDVPGVLYKDNQGEKKITPFNGAWDMRNTKYFRGAEIKSWVLLNFANPRFCNDETLDTFSEMLCKVASGEGIAISRPSSIETVNIRQKSVANALRNAKKKYNTDLAIVVIPNGSKKIYEEVKQNAETDLGLVTQCITDRNLTNVVRKNILQVVSNLCQKINAKMGGVNNSLMSGELPAVMREPVMLIGADVTHSSPTSDNSEFGISIAAVVASLDKHPSRYAVAIRAQKHRDENKESVEIIVELQNMVVELLKAFYRHTKHKKPKRIIFYRDGVSEGQFDAVRKHEIPSVRLACKAVQADGYEPAITFIVVQKRHHTRFMPQDSRQGVGRMKNIPPGTTVDTIVTHPLNFDFFLCSHVGIQGTSRPCHYTVLHDDNGFTADDLQKLTFYLCHTYARCTRSIACPSPVMYAHLAAYRASKYLKSEEYGSSASSTGTERSSAQSDMFRLEKVQKAIKVIEGLADTMYFV